MCFFAFESRQRFHIYSENTHLSDPSWTARKGLSSLASAGSQLTLVLCIFHFPQLFMGELFHIAVLLCQWPPSPYLQSRPFFWASHSWLSQGNFRLTNSKIYLFQKACFDFYPSFLVFFCHWMASRAASSQVSRQYLRFLPLLPTQLWVGFPRKQTLRLLCRWSGGTWVPAETAPWGLSEEGWGEGISSRWPDEPSTSNGPSKLSHTQARGSPIPPS